MRMSRAVNVRRAVRGRSGTYKILHRMNNGLGRKGDIETLVDLADNIEGQTICPLVAAAAWPIQAMVKKFPEEFEALCK